MRGSVYGHVLVYAHVYITNKCPHPNPTQPNPTGGILANKKGRRGALLINAFIFLFGGLLLCAAPSIYWLIPARFVIGLASGACVRACV